MAQPISAFKKLLKIELNGKISLGKLNCCRIFCWLFMEKVASDRALEKNIQGKMPESIKRAKFFISILKILVNTNTITNIIKTGFINAQKIPKIEPLYFALSWEIDISHKVCR